MRSLISENAPKQGSRDLYRFKTASQGSSFRVSSFFYFFPFYQIIFLYTISWHFPGISCKSSLQLPHHQSAGGGVVVIRSCSYQIQIKNDHQCVLEQVRVAVWKNVEKNTYYKLTFQSILYEKINRIFFFFFCFSFSLHISNLDKPLASVVLPTIPQSFVMFCFTLLGSQIDLYFWNRMPDYFASARGAYKSPACQNLCIFTLLLLWPDTGQHRSPAKILISRRRQKKLNCLSSY